MNDLAPSQLVSQYEVHLNSRHLASNGAGGYQVALARPLQLPSSAYHFQLQVSSAEIPVCWYPFSAALDNVTLTIDSVLALTLPDSSYDGDTLAAALTSEVGVPYTATFSTALGRLLLTSTDVGTPHTINGGSSELARFLGLGETDLVIPADAADWAAPYPLNVLTVKALYLHSSLLSDNCFQSVFGSAAALPTGIIDKLAVEVPFGELLSWGGLDSSTFAIHVHRPSISSFYVSWRDENGRVIDVPSEWTLTLQIDVMLSNGGPPPAPPMPVGHAAFALGEPQELASGPTKGARRQLLPLDGPLEAPLEVSLELDEALEPQVATERPRDPSEARADDLDDLRLKVEALKLLAKG